MILDEAIPDATRRFGTAGRVAIGGISMGGFGALHLAALAPARFCAVAVRSAALWHTGGETPAGAFDDASDFDRSDVFAAARAGRFRDLPTWVDDGDRDPFLAADTDFAHQVGAVFHEWPGAHTYAYWDAHVPAYLSFLARACRWGG
jgi:S-formylglutathione hydrolase FrmB